jgi:GT2 family glycosyltransferase
MTEITPTADLAVVIVTHNVRALALNALDSLMADLNSGDLRADVYVVDSASSDDTVAAIRAQFPQVRVIASAENLGFARANNLGLRQIGFGEPGRTLPRAIYLLNPDTITQPGATQTLYDTLMSKPSLGLVGARLSYGDGSFQHSAFAFPGLRQIWTEFFPTPGRFIEGTFNGRYPRRLYESGEPFEVDFVLGATMMLRREVVEQTGMFDEQFFMYCEEIDWAWRIHNSGWAVCCVPAAHVVHLGGQSTGQARPRSLIDLWTSRLRLFDKYYPRWKLWLARRLIGWGMSRRIQQAEASDLPDANALIDAYRTVQKLALG